MIGFAHRKVAPEIRYCTRSKVQAIELQLDDSECERCQCNESDLPISREWLWMRNTALLKMVPNDFAPSYCRCGVLVESRVSGSANFRAPR